MYLYIGEAIVGVPEVDQGALTVQKEMGGEEGPQVSVQLEADQDQDPLMEDQDPL